MKRLLNPPAPSPNKAEGTLDNHALIDIFQKLNLWAIVLIRFTPVEVITISPVAISINLAVRVSGRENIKIPDI